MVSHALRSVCYLLVLVLCFAEQQQQSLTPLVNILGSRFLHIITHVVPVVSAGAARGSSAGLASWRPNQHQR